MGVVLEGEVGVEAPRGVEVGGEGEEREESPPLNRDMMEVEGGEEEEEEASAVLFPGS